jgi:ferredoxin
MPMKIVEECVNCGACETECPNDAIAPGDSSYEIAAEKCTECVGAYDAPQCISSCPIEGCIVLDPDHVESKEQLAEKYSRLHAA